ncbi:Endo-beta-N-acetylglucosaminidase [Candidatus Arthromitus sp. SFB-4]|nr:Endo-beta-N-acetylglucosaminidase [Candidatus Arthromitus sp. SFB-4]
MVNSYNYIGYLHIFEITFTNLSSQVTENLEWTFEGATVQNSTEISPTVKYENEGTYKVSLKAKKFFW